MIRTRHHPFFHFFFRNYFKLIIKKSFKEIAVSNTFNDKGRPILLLSNHFSWWDGFFAYELNRKIFNRRLYLMMLEEQLIKHRYFRKIGAFSIAPGTRSAKESLEYAAEKLRSPDNMVVLFPQGKITSQYTFPVDFMSGWLRIVQKCNHEIQIVFLVNLTDYFSNRKPTLYSYLKEFKYTRGFDLKEFQDSYNQFYKESVNSQILKQ